MLGTSQANVDLQIVEIQKGLSRVAHLPRRQDLQIVEIQKGLSLDVASIEVPNLQIVEIQKGLSQFYLEGEQLISTNSRNSKRS